MNLYLEFNIVTHWDSISKTAYQKTCSANSEKSINFTRMQRACKHCSMSTFFPSIIIWTWKSGTLNPVKIQEYMISN